MQSTYSSDRLRLTAAATLAAALTWPASAHAQSDSSEDVTAACVRAYETAQENRNAEHLIEARQQLRTCAAPACPAMIQNDCMTWLGQVVELVPSVVFAAKRGSESVFDVSVSVDGKPAVTQLDGNPLEIDPGLHTFIFERAGAPPIEKKMIVATREKGQTVAVAWPEPVSPPPPAPPPLEPIAKERPIPPLFWALGGAAVVGFGGFAAFGLTAQATRHDLRTGGGCSPHCSNHDVSGLKTELILADVAVGVGAASAAGALVVFLTRPERYKPSAIGVSSVGIAPVAEGLTLQCKGSF